VFLLAPPFVFAGKARRIERLHAHFATYPALLAWIAASFLKIPFTFTAHAHDIYVNQDLLPIVCGTAAEIVVISEYNRRFIVEKLGEEFAAKITVIHCGIDLNRLPFAERRVRREGALRLVSIGRLSGIKGFTFLIEALRLLQKTGCDFCCTIVGDGPLRKELERQVAEAGLSDRVDLVGSKKAEEIPPILQTADLFVLACAKDRIEGQDGIPVVFMEAMAQGLPVLGTRLSGIPELIRHEETGLLAQPHDPADLMRQIRFFSENPAAAEAMRAKARALVEAEFDAAKNCRLLRESVFCCNEAPSAVTV
jgi:glycosyltransferase involved in cell wall biosynthesis